MTPIKPALFLMLLCASLLAAVQAHASDKTILPDACGDDNVRFDVKTEKGQPAPPSAPAGKAQVVFIEDDKVKGGPFTFYTFRFGMDGEWVGADYGDSFFVINVDPGVHHICVSPQSVTRVLKENVSTVPLTAESGKVYYLVARFKTGLMSLTQLNEDEGKYRVKAFKLATWKTNK